MTKEEVIEKIKKSMECHDRKVCGLAETCEECPLYVDKDTEYEAHKVLIKALEQEPCEDAISREDALEALNTINGTAELDKAFEVIENLPSVTPSRRKGHWILADEQNKEDVENDNYRFICSECQCSDIHAKDTIVPYCWKCGAEMDGKE